VTTPQIIRANVYVDGFNLYRGLLKGNAARKRLDLRALATRMFPDCTVGRVRYFTANVTAPRHDPGMSQRQQTYIRALRAQPDLHTHFGHFNAKIVKGSLLDSHDNPTWVMERVRTMEEKGSDVNLATYLLLDAFGGHYDAAIIISNDSDLEEPIRRVRQRFGVAVDVLNPTRVHSSILQRVASSYASAGLADARACQPPTAVQDKQGTITKPRGW
jgi:uncharacterized LabA/DUF88 family protein